LEKSRLNKMMSHPEVSVVMSVYNGAHYLRAAVESVLDQQGVAFEFVIVNDGSTDESPAILAEYAARDPRLRVVHQENTGLTQALIRGCREARGEFIARQDADDISLPRRLAGLANLLRSDRRLTFVSSHVDVVGPNGERLLTHMPPSDPQKATKLLFDGKSGPPGHGSVMFRRNIYETVGGYRAEFYFAQDCDLWLRLGEQGLLGYVPEVLYQYRVAPQSISGNLNPSKRAFAESVRDCRALRLQGISEEPVLSRCRQFRGGDFKPCRQAEGATLYFLGRNLLTTNPASSSRYLLRCLARQPWHLRAWACLAALPACWFYRLGMAGRFRAMPLHRGNNHIES
jgi:cellulose synthase/poly-beta-1,6-N-acetylglucosamine synthase-like glycosyltransferase